MAERVLAVRGDVVALLAEHLVELRAAVAAHELDARARVLGGEGAQEQEEVLVERVPVSRDPVGDEIVEARLGRRERDRARRARPCAPARGSRAREGRPSVVLGGRPSSWRVAAPCATRGFGERRVGGQRARRHRREHHRRDLRAQAQAGSSASASLPARGRRAPSHRRMAALARGRASLHGAWQRPERRMAMPRISTSFGATCGKTNCRAA